MIDEKKIKLAAEQHALDMDLADNLKNLIDQGIISVAKEKSFRDGAKWALEQSQWIAVTEQIPDEGERVLLIFTSGKIEVGYYYREWRSDATVLSMRERGYTVTHWQALPEPPKQ